jgi:hypothetical protein
MTCQTKRRNRNRLSVKIKRRYLIRGLLSALISAIIPGLALQDLGMTDGARRAHNSGFYWSCSVGKYADLRQGVPVP